MVLGCEHGKKMGELSKTYYGRNSEQQLGL
jgi:hypothetical protein